MKKMTGIVAAAVGMSMISSAVMAETEGTAEQTEEEIAAEEAESAVPDGEIFYEIFVRSFYDSDGDGIGDLKGVTEKLDYIEELGADGIWLMPVMPSPTYHKYDVIDYYEIDPEYGTLEDMEELLEEAEKRGIRVLIDLVFNHTSSEHPWFKEACQYLEELGEAEPDAEVCPYVEYYSFSREQKNSSWYQVGDSDWYYEGVFWSEMPDLKLDNPQVRAEIEDITDYWLELGADGFRLDAAKEYYTGNKDKNIEVLNWYQTYVKKQRSDAYLVAEVWDSVETIASYYQSGIDSIFDYTFGNSDGQIIQKVNQAGNGKAGGAFGRNLEKVQARYLEKNPSGINAPFLSNHDTGRVSGFVSYDEDRIKFAGAMNLFMSGNVFIYYGEEIGMTGSGKDENKRVPMYWSADPETEGMTDGPEDMEPQEHRFASFEDQQNDETSIYQYYQAAVAMRKKYPALAKGITKSLSEQITDGDICALSKTWEDEVIYCIYNFKKEASAVEIPENLIWSEMESLCTQTEQEVTAEGNTIVLPPYGIVILSN